MKTLATTWAVVFAMCCGASALAQCSAKAKDGEAKAAGDKAACAKTCGDKAAAKGCCAGKATAGQCGDAPKLVYKVGDETTCCPKTAAEMAKKNDAKIVYVLAGKEYTDQTEAMTAYRDALETYLDGATQVRFVVGTEAMSCPISAAAMAKEKNTTVKYRVASVNFDNKDDAEKAAKTASEAAEKVSMKMVVDGKTVTCDKSGEKSCCAKGEKTAAKGACPMGGAHETAGQSKAEPSEFIVGDYTTKCPIDARVHLAEARIAAVMKALDQASAKDTTDRTETDRG